MTTPATTVTTATVTTARRPAARALAAAGVVVGLALVIGIPAGAGGLGDPVDPNGTTEPGAESSSTSTQGDGLSTSTSAPVTTPTTEATTLPQDATTLPEDATTIPDDDDATDGDSGGGTSVAALGGVGLVAFVLGLLVAAIPLGAALSRRKAAPAPLGPRPGHAPPPVPTPGPAPAGIAIGPAPARDADQVREQRAHLAEALIGLRDQLPSEALSAQAAGALAAAGIVELSPVGQAFDPAQHRAVDQVPTDDPSRHGTVVAVERPGYADGARVLRQPEVVVARHGAQP